MKKIISYLLILAILIGGVSGTYDVYAENAKAKTETNFKYLITPQSPNWKNFKSTELKKMLNIPVEEAEKIDTETLLEIVLDYPFLVDIYTFNDPIAAIDFISEQFNGLDVLLNRDDLKEKLISSYIDSANMIIKGITQVDSKERFRHKYKESLLSHPKVFNNLCEKEIDEIVIKSEKISDIIDSRSITVEQAKTFGVTISPSAAGDIIKYGKVYTPKNSEISVFERVDMTASDKTYLDELIDSAYPNATRLRSATFKYNCHSYTWYSTSNNNSWWMDDPNKYMSDRSYNKLSSPATGLKVFYPMPGNQHSGIISSVNGGNVTVVSKWGKAGLYSHLEDDCPYATVYQNTYWILNPGY